MASKRDSSEAPGCSGYVLAGQLRFAYEERRWVVAGSEDDDAGTTLRIVVQAPDSEDLIKRYEVRLPIRVDGDDLVVGEPEVREL